MPIYEYSCTACQHRFEEWAWKSTDPSPACPECASGDVERLVSSFATDWRPSIVNWHRMGSWGTKPPKKNF